MNLARGDGGPAEWRRLGVLFLQTVILVTLAAIAVAEILVRSRAILYTPDEIINLDAAITFLRSGDYTTVKWHSRPFDPAISSGLLATWIDGIVFLLGGNLLQVRIVRALAHLAIAMVLFFVFLRQKSLQAFPAAVMALILWLAVVLIPHHSVRLISPGEIWALLYLMAGLFFVRRRPLVATLLWGVAIWLCKMIYLPFAVALFIAHLLALRSERRLDLDSRRFVALCCLHAAVFLAPLALWMSIIWARYDLATVFRWGISFFNFVFTHTTGVEVELPGLQGWRFSPGWPTAKSLLFYEGDVTLPFLIPLVWAPLLLGAYRWLGVRGTLESNPRETYFLVATTAAVAVLSIWFFLFDPTQWGRHLMPAIYVSIALVAYCLAEIWRQRVLPATAFALIVACLGVWVAAQTISDIRADQRATAWKMSFASTCRGPELLRPPCLQDQARRLIATECGEDLGCLQNRRKELLQQAAALIDASPEDRGTAYVAGFLVIYVQHNSYFDRADFEKDVGPILCAADSDIFRDYLEAAGLEVERLLRGCS